MSKILPLLLLFLSFFAHCQKQEQAYVTFRYNFWKKLISKAGTWNYEKNKAKLFSVRLEKMDLLKVEILDKNKARFFLRPVVKFRKFLSPWFSLPCHDIPVLISWKAKSGKTGIGWSKIIYVSVAVPKKFSFFPRSKEPHLSKENLDKIDIWLREQCQKLSCNIILPWKVKMEGLKFNFPEPNLHLDSEKATISYRKMGTEKKYKEFPDWEWALCINEAFLENLFKKYWQSPYAKKFSVENVKVKFTSNKTISIVVHINVNLEKEFPRQGKMKAIVKAELGISYAPNQICNHRIRNGIRLLLIRHKIIVRRANNMAWKKVLKGAFALLEIYLSSHPTFFLPESKFKNHLFIQGESFAFDFSKVRILYEKDILYIIGKMKIHKK